MKRSQIKLEARRNLNSGSRAAAVTALYFIMRIAVFSALVFFVLCIFSAPEQTKIPVPVYAFRAVFAVSAVICLWLMCILKFLLRRCFFLNGGRRKISSFFKILPLNFQIKIIYAHLVSSIFNTACVIFFFAPAAVTAAVIFYRLNAFGMRTNTLAVSVVLLAVLIFIGFYFSTVSAQKTAFFDECLILNPKLKAGELIKTAFMQSDGCCFDLAKLKFSFALWVLLCVLIFPLLFVAPYYLQTLAEYKRQALISQMPALKNISYCARNPYSR